MVFESVNLKSYLTPCRRSDVDEGKKADVREQEMRSMLEKEKQLIETRQREFEVAANERKLQFWKAQESMFANIREARHPDNGAPKKTKQHQRVTPVAESIMSDQHTTAPNRVRESWNCFVE